MRATKLFSMLVVALALAGLTAVPALAETNDGQNVVPPAAVVDPPQEEQPIPDDPATGEMVPMLPPGCEEYAYMPCSPPGRTIPCTYVFPWWVSSCVCSADEGWLCP